MVVRKFGWAALLIAGLLLPGCGGASDSGASADGGPEAAVSQFLAAAKQGDAEVATGLLTTVAREKSAQYDFLQGSETASYKVLESEIEGDEAQVAVDWTDLNPDGSPHTDRVVWMLKRQEGSWRISGLAMRVFPDTPPAILNFEDPEEMARVQQAAEEEIARRAAQQGAMTAENPELGAAPEATVR